MVKKSSKKKSMKPSKKLIQLKKERNQKTEFITETEKNRTSNQKQFEKKDTYFYNQLLRAYSSLDKIDKMIDKLK